MHASVARAPAHRVIAFYLPQFYPIPENDDWWEPGYTEWSVVARARPMFPGHRQPRYPTELGYYDLRVSETREAQAELAKHHGVEGFCYWHYWLGNGHRLLERPFDEVLRSGKPDFPFCLAWANHDWYDKRSDPWKLLAKQEYPGPEDEITHFRTVEPAFHDPRYMRVDGRPILLLFQPDLIPNLRRFTDHWRELASRSGLSGIYFIGRAHRSDFNASLHGLDAVQAGSWRPLWSRSRIPGQQINPDFILSGLSWWVAEHLKIIEFQSYRRMSLFIPHLAPSGYSFPVVYSNWDCTPRRGRRGSILLGESTEAFSEQLRIAATLVADRPVDHRIVFLKSWNEWAEGNYIEPDRHHGRDFLLALRRHLEMG